jgi:penicillin-binding protein 1C
MEVLYPEPGGRLLIPTELDGTRGKAVIEVAHRDPAARLYWDMDGVYLGTTTGDHRMAIDPADGPHTLTLTDDQGHVLRHSFAVSGHRRR